MLARALIAAACVCLAGCGDGTTRAPKDAGVDGMDDAAAPGTLAACLEDLPSRRDVRVQRFRTEDGGIELAFASSAPADYCTDDAFCACNGGTCGSYELLRFGVRVGNGDVECITDAAQLMYQGGQHAWGDTATARGRDAELRVKMLYDFEASQYVDSLELLDLTSGAPIADEAPLVSEDCYAIPTGVNEGCCERCQSRARSDD